MTALGLTDKNPLNLGYRQQDKWVGLASPPNNGRWCVFSRPEYAFRAYTHELVTYIREGHDTVPKFITTWAPPSENPTPAYITNVLRWSHLTAQHVLDPATDALPLFKAMCHQEDGSDPYGDEIIQMGVDMALENISLQQAATPVAAEPVAIAPIAAPVRPAAVSSTALVAGAGGIGYAFADLIAGGLHDIWHIDITSARQAALALVITVILHQLFPKSAAA